MRQIHLVRSTLECMFESKCPSCRTDVRYRPSSKGIKQPHVSDPFDNFTAPLSRTEKLGRQQEHSRYRDLSSTLVFCRFPLTKNCFVIRQSCGTRENSSERDAW